MKSGIEVYYDGSLKAVNSFDFTEDLKYKIEASEAVLFILSKDFFRSEWSKYEFSSSLAEFHKRKINIIPVIIERTSIPSDLLDYEIVNLSNNFESGIEKIVKKLKVIPEISFDNFSSKKFEDLIEDLLKEYDFKNIESQVHTRDHGFDFMADYESKSPFGILVKESWIIEVKFYKQERFSISSIKQLIDYKSNFLRSHARLLLVTNSILTSVVQEYLDNYKKHENIRVEVIDGVQLRHLISKRKRLLDKYFRS
jgi:hypothetical protein